jgi:methylenetetrahydrofolate reductase (NADPH)
MNELGYLTINSQPAVDGVPSDDRVHGWGPAGGYVYQKVSAAAPLTRSASLRSIQYFAVSLSRCLAASPPRRRPCGALTDARPLQAYLEFFVSPSLLSALIRRIERDPRITYFAVNKGGDLRTNNHSEGPNAVTWGVFPGKEIVQPTIVEAISFIAWK